MTLSVKEVTDSVLHIQAKTQFDIASTFMRLQEFYESPFREVRGKLFTHEDFINLYAYRKERKGDDEVIFSYFEDWQGFNIPGNVFNRWVKRFKKAGMWEKEQELIDLVYDKVNKRSNKFYVIGTFEYHDQGNVINHELSHAFFYLDKQYKSESTKLYRKLPKVVRYQMHEWLKSMGYDRTVYTDETVAYLSTDTMCDLDDKLTPVPWKKVLEFQQLFEETRDKKLSEMKDKNE